MAVFYTASSNTLTTSNTTTWSSGSATIARRIYIDKTINISSIATYVYDPITIKAVIYSDAGSLLAQSSAQTGAGTRTFPISVTLSPGFYKIGVQGSGITGSSEANATVTRTVSNTTFTAYSNDWYVSGDAYPSAEVAHASILQMAITFTDNAAPNAPSGLYISNGGPYVANIINNSTGLGLSSVVTDPDGNNLVQYQLVGSTDGWATWAYNSGQVACNVASGGTVTHTIPAGTLYESNNWVFALQVADPSGAWSPWAYYSTVIVDKTPPVNTSVSSQQYTKTNAATVWAYGVTDANGINSVDIHAVRPDNSWYYLGTMTKNGATNDFSYNLTDINVDGNWHYDIRPYDRAGNVVASYKSTYVFRDTVAPNVPTQTNGSLYATSNGVTWSAFADTAPSSGLLSTTIYLQSYNGSVWSNVATFPKSVSGTSYSFTGLTPASQYRWGIVYGDYAGNSNTLNYTTFTTNSYSSSTIVNLTSSGALISQRPKVKFSVTDPNSATLTNFQIQISTVNTFATTIIDTTSGANSTGWQGTSTASGSTNGYTPQTNLGTGVLYVRVRASDGLDWGNWSTTVSFTINTISWSTVIADADTAISKRTIDTLRANVNTVRQARGLAVATWTDTTINDWNNVSRTNIRATHLIELRQAITDIYVALSISSPTWTDNIITAGTTPRKGKHWSEMRTYLQSA